MFFLLVSSRQCGIADFLLQPLTTVVTSLVSLLAAAPIVVNEIGFWDEMPGSLEDAVAATVAVGGKRRGAGMSSTAKEVPWSTWKVFWWEEPRNMETEKKEALQVLQPQQRREMQGDLNHHTAHPQRGADRRCT